MVNLVLRHTRLYSRKRAINSTKSMCLSNKGMQFQTKDGISDKALRVTHQNSQGFVPCSLFPDATDPTLEISLSNAMDKGACYFINNQIQTWLWYVEGRIKSDQGPNNKKAGNSLKVVKQRLLYHIINTFTTLNTHTAGCKCGPLPSNPNEHQNACCAPPSMGYTVIRFERTLYKHINSFTIPNKYK